MFAEANISGARWRQQEAGLPIVTAASSPETNRFGYLDGMRGWAALLVVFHHGAIGLDFALYTGQKVGARGAWDLWLSGTPFFPLASGGSLAVCLFFALSGYVLAHAYSRSRQGWAALVLRRYVRLGIPMLVGCVFSWMLLSLGLILNQPAALITRSSWLDGQFRQTPRLLAAVAEPVRLLGGGVPSFGLSYDSSLWTMPIEAGASLVLITLFVGLRRAGRHAARIEAAVFCVLNDSVPGLVFQPVRVRGGAAAVATTANVGCPGQKPVGHGQWIWVGAVSGDRAL